MERVAGALTELATFAALVDAVDAALPQTQCTRCGYPNCSRYAEAIAAGDAPINRCPPGGQAGIERLAQITGQPVQPLDPANGVEGPLRRASIDEAWCIGCTLCLEACPVDCIVGAAKLMHTVVEAQCTGCELCIAVCPVDCISMQAPILDATGWDAWSPAQAEEARDRYAFHRAREARVAAAEAERLAGASLPSPQRHDATARDDRTRTVQAALARARREA